MQESLSQSCLLVVKMFWTVSLPVNGLILLFIYAQLSISAGLPTKPLKPVVAVRQGQNITLPCTAFSSKALEVEKGRFRYLRWYMWAYNGVKAQWVPLAWMKEDGDVKVDRDLYKGFNISRDDGGLYIHEAQPCHAQKFLCSVVLWSGRNPVTSNVTLRLTDGNENRPTEKPEPTEVRTTSDPRNQENRPTEKPEPTEVRTTSESRNQENRPIEKPEPTEVRTTSESKNQGLPTKPLDPEIVYARHGQSITLPCSAFEEALQLEGDHVCYVRWSNRTYDGVETQWVPFAMMNGDGGIYVDGDGRFNISKDDGGLYIHEAHPSDNQIYMCTVVLCSGRSPLKNYVTLEFLDDKENPATEKPKPSEAATTRGSKNSKREKVDITDSYRDAFIVATTIAAISVFANVVQAVFYRLRSHRSTN